MSRFTCVSVFIVTLFQLSAQTVPATVAPPGGFTIGVNLVGPVNWAIDRDRRGISFISRVNLKDQWFLLGEIGYENLSIEGSRYNYSSSGSFLRAGFEYDALGTQEHGNNGNLLVGLHYGYAIQDQASSRFVIENDYWGDHTGVLGSHTVNTHWLELAAGPRVELYRNLYMGWNLQLKIALFSDNPGVLSPYLTPGFGNGDNRMNIGFSYNIEFMIPWKKGK